MTYKFLMTAPELGEGGRKILTDAGCEVDYLQQSNDAREVEHLMASRAYDAVISRTALLSAKAINACPTLKIICKHGVGVTNIDVEAASARRIPVLTTPGTNAQSVAELTIALMFSAARHLPFFQREIAELRWTRTGGGFELHGKRLGLVGYGEIGRRVSHIAQAIGMQVAFFDPGFKGNTEHKRYTNLVELLRSSQVLSLHCPVNADTRKMLNRLTLALLPQGAMVINTSRGGLIDENALAEALAEGALAAAGLDTFSEEPLPAEHPLRRLRNVVMTPHIGGSTSEALDAVAQSAAGQCLDFLQNHTLDWQACVNFEAISPLEGMRDDQQK